MSDVDRGISEDFLASVFQQIGPVQECRICGDPNSTMRFAFVEFANEQAAKMALGLNGTPLGACTIRVLPSRTSIQPVNKMYLPRNDQERLLCERTVYVANVDNVVNKNEIRTFFELTCGQVGKLRLLSGNRNNKRIAFVEFIDAGSAQMALNCSGAMLGMCPIRVSPSKTPVREPRSHAREVRAKARAGLVAPAAE